MNYREFRSSPSLQRYVECFWTLSTNSESEAPSRDKVLPDGCTELIFNLADPFKRYHPDGIIELQPRTLIVGQMRCPALIQPTGRVKLFGIRFRPSGAYPFLRFPQHELDDMILDLKTVWSSWGMELEERIHSLRPLRVPACALRRRFCTGGWGIGALMVRWWKSWCSALS